MVFDVRYDCKERGKCALRGVGRDISSSSFFLSEGDCLPYRGGIRQPSLYQNRKYCRELAWSRHGRYCHQAFEVISGSSPMLGLSNFQP